MSSLTLHHAGKKRKVVNVILLDGTQCLINVDVKSKFHDVFNQIATQLSLRETEYFGLSQKKEGEYHFLPLEEKIHKFAPKSWKSGTSEGLDTDGQPLVSLYFRVQFYVDQIVLLREKVTRHLYFLQLKDNIHNYGHVSTEEKCFQLVSYALQADSGNYIKSKHSGQYFDPREYFPAWICNKRGKDYICKNTPLIHQDLHNLSKSEAEFKFIREASISPAAYNLHFYRLKKRKTDKNWNAWLGICAKGIEIYEEVDESLKNLISTFLWPDIGKLFFEKKKFEIRAAGAPEGRKFAYYTDCDTKSKYLLQLCKQTHMFQLAIHPKLMEIRHLEEQDKKRYRELYIYSDPKDLKAHGGSFRGSLSPSTKSVLNVRYSVVSNASSNTTSGIASDKMTISFEDEEHNREIMIDSPPMFGNPSQNNAFSTLPNYMPSSKMNRSPGAESGPRELFKSSSVGRPAGGNRQMNRSPDRIASISQQQHHAVYSGTLSTSYSGNSIERDISPNSSGRYQGHFPVHNAMPLPLYSSQQMNVPIYMNHTPSTSLHNERLCLSQPVSRSASRADSFKSNLTQLQIHTSDNHISPYYHYNKQMYQLPAYNNYNTFNGQMQAAQACDPALTSSQNIDPQYYQYHELSGSQNINQFYHNPDLSGSQNMNQFYHNNHDLSGSQNMNQFYPNHDLSGSQNMNQFYHHSHEQGYETDLSGSQNMNHFYSQESFTGQIVENQGVMYVSNEMMIPGMTSYVSQSNMSNSSYTETKRTLQEHEVLAPPPMFADMSEHLNDSKHSCNSNTSLNKLPTEPSDNEEKKPTLSTSTTELNSGETLHPELETIKADTHALSLPLMYGLCNDKSLYMPITQPMDGSVESYENSTIRSTDSRISRISHDFDPRRLSAVYPSGQGPPSMSQRPFSWHSENFDLDAQITAMNGQTLEENHRSVPQNLGHLLASPSWTNSISYSDQYSSEYSHIVQPPARGINSQSGLQETIGIA
ncbi:uncharacterized protein LOC134710159 [Mytilus trossulus]|uniref:uncharacterized protein LOC134710159 n=1 Tax=Mytilus trossulus TaxID=6551 RepID=UPI0030053122